MFSVDDASWTLKLWNAMLNHAISLKGQMQGDNIFNFYAHFLE